MKSSLNTFGIFSDPQLGGEIQKRENKLKLSKVHFQNVHFTKAIQNKHAKECVDQGPCGLFLEIQVAAKHYRERLNWVDFKESCILSYYYLGIKSIAI
jgi:hypothetical protein